MKEQNKRVSAAELARIADYSPAAITVWTTTGILKRARGKYDLKLSLEAIKRHELLRGSDGGHDRGELAGLKRQLLEKKIAKLDHELNVLTGKVHDKEKCCLSLTQLFSAESRELHNLGRRILAQLPELPKNFVTAVDKEVDDMLHRLKYGLAYRGKYFCPHCTKLIDEFRLEPLPEDQQSAPVASVPGTDNTNAGATAI